MNPFDDAGMALGYARARPAVHERILERAWARMGRRFSRAIDIGCGAGISTRAIGAAATSVVGIDPSEAMVRAGRAVAPGAWFAVASAERLPFEAGSADLLTAAGSLNYVDLGRFFPEALRVLAADGVLLVYDFSTARRGPAGLERWFLEFEGRYPWPAGEAVDVTPEALDGMGGMRVAASERVQVGVDMTANRYLEYVLTETNVAHALRTGESRDAVRDWCATGLQPLFDEHPHEVLFDGYWAAMTR